MIECFYSLRFLQVIPTTADHSPPESPMATATPSTTTAPPANEWTIVIGRNRRSNRPTTSSQPLQRPIPWAPLDSPSSPTSLLYKIHKSTSKLSTSPFFTRFLSHLRSHSSLLPRLSISTVHLVTYGIGSIASFEAPRLQLSLALLLHRELNLPHRIQLFDPILTSAECAAISLAGCDVLTIDEAACREVLSPTLFYMPHCEAFMYDNLLRVNWRRERLNHMIVLGNSFREYESFVTGLGRRTRVEGEARYVVKACEMAEEVRIDREEGGKGWRLEEDGDEALFAAFHSTSWHLFDLDREVEEVQ